MHFSYVCLFLLSILVVQISSETPTTKPSQKATDVLSTLSEMARGQMSELSKIAPLKPYVDDLQSALDGVSAKVTKFSKELDKIYADGPLSPEAKVIVKDLSDTVSSAIPLVLP